MTYVITFHRKHKTPSQIHDLCLIIISCCFDYRVFWPMNEDFMDD